MAQSIPTGCPYHMSPGAAADTPRTLAPSHEAIDVAWMRLDEVHRQLTFPNERRIAQTAWNRLAGTA